MFSAVQHRVHTHDFSLSAVIDGKREAFRKTAVISVDDLMNSGMHKQGIDVGEQIVEKVRAKSCFATFVEAKALNEILLSLIEDLNSHDSLLRISFFAASQSTNRAVPSATR